jgi:hypothetical protein
MNGNRRLGTVAGVPKIKMTMCFQGEGGEGERVHTSRSTVMISETGLPRREREKGKRGGGGVQINCVPRTTACAYELSYPKYCSECGCGNAKKFVW